MSVREDPVVIVGRDQAPAFVRAAFDVGLIGLARVGLEVMVSRLLTDPGMNKQCIALLVQPITSEFPHDIPLYCRCRRNVCVAAG